MMNIVQNPNHDITVTALFQRRSRIHPARYTGLIYYHEGHEEHEELKNWDCKESVSVIPISHAVSQT